MMSKQEVLAWVNTVGDDCGIAIDEGGLSLVEIGSDGDETGAYLEVGMTPQEEDDLNGDGEDSEDEDQDDRE